MPRSTSLLQRCLDTLDAMDMHTKTILDTILARLDRLETSLQLLQDQVVEIPQVLNDEIHEQSREIRMVQHDLDRVQHTVIDLTQEATTKRKPYELAQARRIRRTLPWRKPVEPINVG